MPIRSPISRFVCKRKLSQNKDESRRRAIAALPEPGPCSHPELADEMERELEIGLVDPGPTARPRNLRP